MTAAGDDRDGPQERASLDPELPTAARLPRRRGAHGPRPSMGELRVGGRRTAAEEPDGRRDQQRFRGRAMPGW